MPPPGILCALVLVMTVVLLSIVACDRSGDGPLGPDRRTPTMSREDAMGLLRESKFDDAIDALRPYASAESPSTDVLFAYAQALMGAHRQSLAVWPLQRLIERADAPAATPRLFVTALLYGGADRESVREATRILDENPDARLIRSLRAQGYEAILDLESALEDVEILVEESPGEARWVERLLNLLIKMEDWDSARERITELRGLLERDGVKPEARAVFCATAARFEKQHGNPEVAEEQLRGCLEKSPFDTNLIFSLVELLDQSERVSEATSFLEGISEQAPKRQLIQQGLAFRYTRLGRHDEADALLLKTAMDVQQPAAWLALGDLRVLRGDLAGAAEAVDRAVELALGKPSDDPTLEWSRLTPESRFGLGDVYIRARKFEPADRIIESLDDEPAFGLLLRARARLDRGDPAGALADYQEAFRSYPSHPAARYLAARAALEVGDFDLAIAMYQDSLRSDASATDAGLVLGQMLLAEGRTNWAMETLSFYLASAEEEPHALRLMAQAGAASGQHKWAESVRAVLSNNAEWVGLALADQAKDIAYLKGAEEARKYLAESPSLEESAHFEAFTAWVGYSNALGDAKAARDRARALTKHNPDAAGAWIVWSRILYEDGEKDEAIEAIRRAIELNPMIATASAELGEMLLGTGQIDEAIAAFDRASEVDPLDARAAISAVNGLLAAGRTDDAERRLRELLIHHPWHGRAALMLVDLVRDRGEVDEWTYQMARRAARFIGISGPRAHSELAQIELDRGNVEEAAKRFEMAIQAKYEIPNMQYGLAKALIALDRRNDALEVLELALASENLKDPVAASALAEELRAGEQTP